MTQTIVNKIIETYIVSLTKSGYGKDEIEKAITPGIVGFERRVRRQEEGGTPIHTLFENIQI